MRKFLIVLLTAGSLAAFGGAADAQAYLHLDNCQSGLRYGGGGDVAHDDDIHNYGVRYGYDSWGGWQDYTRTAATSLRVYAWMHKDGRWYSREFICSGNDGFFNDDYSFNF